MERALVVKAVAEATKEISSLTAKFLAGKEVARLKYRIEAGMKYVFVDEGAGEFEKLSDDGKKKMKLHYRKRVFDER